MVPGSSHSSCTVEMANLNKPVDVAVIDEIQVRCHVPAALQTACCSGKHVTRHQAARPW